MDDRNQNSANNQNPDLQPVQSTDGPIPGSEYTRQNTSVSLPKLASNKRRFMVLEVIVLIIVAGIISWVTIYNHNNSNSKKDIPYLNFGLFGSENLTPTYPTEASDDDYTAIIDFQLFEGLVRYQDTIKIQPTLATSWYNPNDTTWIFNLRHNVKFHSGRTMTATDVKYSLDYAVTHQSNSGSLLALSSSINSVKILNPYQVEIITNGPDAILLNQLTSLLIVDSKAKLGDPNAGTGPYTIKPGTINSNGTSFDLVAFNQYWGGHVYTREVRIKEVPTLNELATDTAKGEFDFTGNFNDQQLAIIKAKAKYYQPVAIPDLGVSYLELNLENPSSPLYNLTARQAMAYALNVSSIIKAGNLQGNQASQVIPSTLPGYDPSIKDTPYDPAKAKQLLATVPNASSPITLVYSTADSAIGNEIAKQLDAVGFNVRTSSMSNFNTFVNMIVAGQGDMFYLSYITDTLDGLDMINNTVAGTANYTSTELTNLINQASSTFNPVSRITVLQKIEQSDAATIPTIPLFTQTRVYALTKPYVVSPQFTNVDPGTYFYQIYQK